MGSKDIWRPDIHLYNNADGANMEHFGDIYFLVYRSVHGIMGKRFPDGGLLRYRK